MLFTYGLGKFESAMSAKVTVWPVAARSFSSVFTVGSRLPFSYSLILEGAKPLAEESSR